MPPELAVRPQCGSMQSFAKTVHAAPRRMLHAVQNAQCTDAQTHLQCLRRVVGRCHLLAVHAELPDSALQHTSVQYLSALEGGAA